MRPAGHRPRPGVFAKFVRGRTVVKAVGRSFFFCVLLMVASGGFPAFCGEGDFSESAGISWAAANNGNNRIKHNENVGSRLALFFRNYISRVDGDRCPSLPSCSSYSVQAFRKHGFFVGWVMTVDRLIHEADERSVSPVVYYEGKFRIIDPVENNDFWWFHGDAPSQR